MGDQANSYPPAVTTQDVETGEIATLAAAGKRRMFRIAYWEVVDEVTAIGYALAPGDEPVPVGLVHYPVPLTSLGLRGLRVAAAIKAPVRSVRIESSEPPGPDEVARVYRLASGKSVVKVGPIVYAFPHRRDDESADEFYARVADRYREVDATSGKPVAGISKSAQVPYTTAARWVREARKRGHLAPVQHDKPKGE